MRPRRTCIRFTPRTELTSPSPQQKRHKIVARSPATTTSSRLKCVPGAVAIPVHKATHASRPTCREPFGAGVVFSTTQSRANQLGQRGWIMMLKHIVESPNNFRCLGHIVCVHPNRSCLGSSSFPDEAGVRPHLIGPHQG